METKSLMALRVRLASPETIKSWSYGEVTKPETINYRRLRPEKDGLFCEAIFGPTRDYQCYCGKYKNPRYKGIVCDKCGVEVTRSSVRRERMGHIELATPVAHIWYSRRVPSYLGSLLNISRRNLDRVLYFAQYIVTYVDEDSKQKALNRIEDEVSVKFTEQINDLNSRIEAVETDKSSRLEEIKARNAELASKKDEMIAEKMAPIIKEGQDLEQSIQEKIGKKTRGDIKLKTMAVTIVNAGEEVTSKMISSIQKHVQEKLESVEAEVSIEIENEKEKNNLLIEQVKAEADLTLQKLLDQKEELTTKIDHEVDARRDEIESLRPLSFISENKYRELRSHYGQVFRADMGAEAFYDILSRLDMEKLAEELWIEVRTTKSKQKRKKATKRLKVVEAFRRSNNRPEWMILKVLPVIPPDLRPMVQLDGGRFATSDLNDLYRRVINRNNRLKRLLELGAPDVIVRNEKRMLQEAVDSLIDNSQRGKALSRRGRRELKSLSDMLKGKKGRFRRNLLGKRVDYSGRSVIVVGPKLKLYQCGLPKNMALELYRPFVIAGLVKREYAANVKGARRLIERNRPEVWEVLEKVIRDRPVMLNRAPTLHRLGIQAFEPILVEGSAIQLHPLVCTAFNADFDGDQMAVHVPLSEKAVWEARNLMLASKNLLKPADGEPIISPSKDMVLGVYYLTMEPDKKKKTEELITFASIDEVELAFQLGQVKIHTPIHIRTNTWYDEDGKRLIEPETRIIQTSVGRAIFNKILPEEVMFTNRTLEKGAIKDLIANIYELCGEDTTTRIADDVKDIGFKYAMLSGTTVAVGDITIPPKKEEILAESLEKVEAIQKSYRRGLLTELEMDEQVIKVWQDTTKEVADAVKEHLDPGGNLATMANSGATKGGFGPISQLAGMRGLMADPAGRIIRLPIQSNFREGLTALEYFISTHGARKGLADTALRTADAGYLTRRLVDIAQDVIINADDCETQEGLWIRTSDDIAGQSIQERLKGRLLAEAVVNPVTGEILADRDELLTIDLINSMLSSGITEMKVRSPLTCELRHGICSKCYGIDLGRGKMVEPGTAVGIIAAQSIGEPGTQLTLRTFHTGGVAAATDITTGLPRVEELFEARKTPKGEAIIAPITGKVAIISSNNASDQNSIRITYSELIRDEYTVPEEWEILAKEEITVAAGDVLAKNEELTINAQHAGRIRLDDDRTIVVSYDSVEEEEMDIPSTLRIIVKDGEEVEAGQPLTEGSINPHELLRLKGRDAAYHYLLEEIQNVYRAQGQNINDKHFEVIIRKMLSKVTIISAGDTDLLPNEMVDRLEIKAINEEIIAQGKKPARYIDVLLGVTKASLNTDSFLSAASFQHTIKELSRAAISADKDPLYGLKENVIIGKLIPAGTGFSENRISLIESIANDEPIEPAHVRTLEIPTDEISFDELSDLDITDLDLEDDSTMDELDLLDDDSDDDDRDEE
ncbi:MAG: DNA-directed RNA polymerase subunit beta' [Chloroflexi bacterium]|nr:DNA-directed RNA polymerase subunit beta' [Chloroflexota bacterium]